MDKNLSPAVAVEYKKIEPRDINISEFSDITNFKRGMTLECQGAAVEFSEKTSLLELMVAFSAAFEVASEAVIRTDSGKMVLLFSHHTQTFLRPEKLIDIFNKELLAAEEKAKFVADVGLPPLEVTINTEKEWKNARGLNENDKIKNFIKSFPKFMEPALSVIFTGEIPALPALFLVYFSRSYGRRIFYMSKDNIKIELF